MVLIDNPLTGNQVLGAFHRDAPYLFLGSAFIAAGLVAIGLCLLRRKFNALLVWLGFFAGLYGLRLWLRAEIVEIGLTDVFSYRLASAIDFLILIPSLNFFRAAGFLGKRTLKFTFVTRTVFLAMFAETLAFGVSPVSYAICGAFVTGALWYLMARSMGRKATDRDFKVTRIGVLCFVILALWDNIVVRYFFPSHLEPYGFAVLLSCMGYVAARRTLERDVELGEIQKELEVARRMQLSILPAAFPASADFRVAARYVPMTSVAGDLYDFLLSADRQAGLLIADVSGHGVPAALIASMVKMAATTQRANAAHPAQLLTVMNAALCGNTQGQFVTAAYVYLDAASRKLRYAAAGHPAMLILRDGVVTEIAENGLMLAMSDLATYSDKTLPIEPGDRLLLYTDGIVEARNAEGKLLGENALFAELCATAKLTPEEAADRIIASAQQWAAVQDDDLTVLVCDFVGAQ
ncbi:MAG: PP2C family protein-serine/threonine phosphatase [Terracidiphilus sp.]|jgi:sigma-B regulation protein RsbU (phosphoserine phosphatase)